VFSSIVTTFLIYTNLKIVFVTIDKNEIVRKYIGCLFKFILKLGVDESIVNAPPVRLLSKNTNNAKSEVN
jgi:hypothetical protein